MARDEPEARDVACRAMYACGLAQGLTRGFIVGRLGERASLFSFFCIFNYFIFYINLFKKKLQNFLYNFFFYFYMFSLQF